MRPIQLIRRLIGAGLVCALASASGVAEPAVRQNAELAFVVGTWTGTSTCVGNRPACKNETVVYRIVPIEGSPTKVRLYADKILDGKRVPMGMLVFDVDLEDRTLRGEFTRGQTHGEWSFSVSGTSMTGNLVVLPDRSVGRDVRVHRVDPGDVPEAPPDHDYDE